MIAATALLSAINAAALKPRSAHYGCAAETPPEQRNSSIAANAVTAHARPRGLCEADRPAGCAQQYLGDRRAHPDRRRRLRPVASADRLYRSRTSYLLVAAQLPDGAALDRFQRVLDQISELAGKTGRRSGDQHRRHIGARQLFGLANAGVAYLVLKEWSARGRARICDRCSSG